MNIRVSRELEDTETVGFRHQFKGWDSVLSIDYSRAIDTTDSKELQLKLDARPKNIADMSGKFFEKKFRFSIITINCAT
jgi:hypothetical protein